jgi:hypothetical protein
MSNSNKCEYCGKTFKRESSMFAHTCEPKRRALQKNDKNVVIGYTAFNQWYRLAMGHKKEKTYAEFSKSKYYTMFVRWGTYVLEIRATNPEAYLRWLVDNQVKDWSWTKDSTYDKYLADYSKKETVDRALERFVKLAEEWASTHNAHFSEYFDKAGVHIIYNDIRVGNISPWILFGSDKAQAVLDEMPGEYITGIANTIDIVFWRRKLKLYPNDVAFINTVLQ